MVKIKVTAEYSGLHQMSEQFSISSGDSYKYIQLSRVPTPTGLVLFMFEIVHLVTVAKQFTSESDEVKSRATRHLCHYNLNFRPLDHVLVCGGGVRNPPLHPFPHQKGIPEQGG